MASTLTLDIEPQGSPTASAETHLLSSFMKIPTASSRASSHNYLKSETLKQVSINVKVLNVLLLALSPTAFVCVYFWFNSVISLIMALFLSICQCVVSLYGLHLETEVTAASVRFYRRSIKSFLMLLLFFIVGMEALFLMDRWRTQSADCGKTRLMRVCAERNGALSLDVLLYVLLPTSDAVLYVLCAYSCKLVNKYARRLKQNIKEDTWW